MGPRQIIADHFWPKQTSFGPCANVFSCVRTRRQNVLSYGRACQLYQPHSQSARSHNSSRKTSCRLDSDLSRGSYQDSRRTVCKQQSAQANPELGTREHVTSLVLLTLGHSLQPAPRISAMIRDAVIALLLPKRPLELSQTDRGSTDESVFACCNTSLPPLFSHLTVQISLLSSWTSPMRGLKGETMTFTFSDVVPLAAAVYLVIKTDP